MQIHVYRDYSGPNPRPTSHSHTGCLCFSSSHPVKKQHAGLCGSVYNNPVIWVVFNSVLNSTLAPLCLCCHEFLSFALSHVWKLNFSPPPKWCHAVKITLMGGRCWGMCVFQRWRQRSGLFRHEVEECKVLGVWICVWWPQEKYRE